jgi:hypothetical protein
MTATAVQFEGPAKLVEVSNPKRVQNTAQRKFWSAAEIEIVKTQYPELGPKKALKLLPGRTHSSLVQKAEKLGIKVNGNHRRRWTDDEIQYIESEWEFTKPHIIARELNRKIRAIINKAENLGLHKGPPEGCDFVTAVANKMGYEPSTFYGILEHFNVKVTRLPTIPQGKRKRTKRTTRRRFKAPHRYVDIMEAEEAVRKWVTETETIPKAAERLEISQHRLTDILIAAGLKVVSKDKKFALRLNSKTLDKLVADWRKKREEDSRFETLLQAADRHGLWYESLRLWLRKAGFDWNPKTRQWRLDPADVDRVVGENLSKSVLARVNGVRVNHSKMEYRRFISILRWRIRETKAAQRSFLVVLKLRAQQQRIVERDAKRKARAELALAKVKLRERKKARRAAKQAAKRKLALQQRR